RQFLVELWHFLFQEGGGKNPPDFFLWTPNFKPLFYFSCYRCITISSTPQHLRCTPTLGACNTGLPNQYVRGKHIILLTTHGTAKTQTRCCQLLQLRNAGRHEDNDTHGRPAAKTSASNPSVTACSSSVCPLPPATPLLLLEAASATYKTHALRTKTQNSKRKRLITNGRGVATVTQHAARHTATTYLRRDGTATHKHCNTSPRGEHPPPPRCSTVSTTLKPKEIQR
ncbi:unnamed protein product, partial [Ectocarpus sp. 6 AP-2014]